MFSMLHPDPMGSPFADAAVSLLRKLTFKGEWTLTFCNIQILQVWGDERMYIYCVDISALYIYNYVDIRWKTRIGPYVDLSLIHI